MQLIEEVWALNDERVSTCSQLMAAWCLQSQWGLCCSLVAAVPASLWRNLLQFPFPFLLPMQMLGWLWLALTIGVWWWGHIGSKWFCCRFSIAWSPPSAGIWGRVVSELFLCFSFSVDLVGCAQHHKEKPPLTFSRGRCQSCIMVPGKSPQAVPLHRALSRPLVLPLAGPAQKTQAMTHTNSPQTQPALHQPGFDAAGPLQAPDAAVTPERQSWCLAPSHPFLSLFSIPCPAGMCWGASLHALLRHQAADGEGTHRCHHRRGSLLPQ